jgi:hypothetical protein
VKRVSNVKWDKAVVGEQEKRAAVAVTVKSKGSTAGGCVGASNVMRTMAVQSEASRRVQTSKGSTVGGCVGATNVMRTMAVDHGAMFPTVI